jgi:[acyl-carrier-protein] S-malonyltransferase
VGFLGGAVVGLLFPGQGSQFVGMGRDLAEASAAARAVFEEADDLLGISLSRLCFEGPEEELTATVNAQPAILVHSIAVYRVVGERLGPVAIAAGHSLGEFSAYVAAGALSLAEGVQTVRRRGELMYGGGQERPGAMAAVLGLDDDVIERVCAEVSTDTEVCVPANFNAPGQVVVSGDADAVDRAIAALREAGARRAVRLNVSGAFHSPLMRVAEVGLRAQLEGVAFAPPRFPVVSNVTAEAVSEVATARDLLVRQLTSPVRWTACMRTMLRSGVDRFIELGPGSVLSGLLRRIDREVASMAVGTAAQSRALEGT